MAALTVWPLRCFMDHWTPDKRCPNISGAVWWDANKPPRYPEDIVLWFCQSDHKLKGTRYPDFTVVWDATS